MRAFPTPEALAEALAASVADTLRGELTRRGAATLAVSGGSTPVRFFAALARQRLDWAHVTITLVDERWVDETSPRSNAALVRAHLLRDQAAAARFLALYTGAPAPEDAALTLPLPLTVAVLGMGADGHTASFFPGGDHLDAALDPAGTATLLPMRAPGAGEPRITLTLPVLAGAGRLILHIEGAAKRHLLETAHGLPIHAVCAARPDIEIFWSPTP